MSNPPISTSASLFAGFVGSRLWASVVFLCRATVVSLVQHSQTSMHSNVIYLRYENYMKKQSNVVPLNKKFDECHVKSCVKCQCNENCVAILLSLVAAFLLSFRWVVLLCSSPFVGGAVLIPLLLDGAAVSLSSFWVALLSLPPSCGWCCFPHSSFWVVCFSSSSSLVVLPFPSTVLWIRNEIV